MKDSTYGLLCAFLLGLGQMCMFTGFDTQSFIMESVLRSVHDQRPHVIDAHAGYYGQAVINVTFTISNLFAPWLLGMLGSKLALVLGSATFTIYLCSYFYVHYVPFYFTTALLGLGFALYYTGNGAYLTEHSSRATIERNSALTWAIGTCCMIGGGVVLLFTTRTPITLDVESTNSTFSEYSYREYENAEIRLMYGVFVIVSLASNLIFAFIPTTPSKESLAIAGEEERLSFAEQMKLIFSALLEPKVIQLIPVFTFVGTSICFWIAVYPTTLIFTKSMSSYIYLPAYYSIVLGGSDMLMGFIISFTSSRIPNFGQMPTLLIGAVLHMTGLTLALLSTPAWSTNTPNSAPAPFIEPSVPLALVVSYLFGLADSCLNTSRTVICALVMPHKRAQVFSISKFYQSFIIGVLLFLSPLLSMPMYYVLIGVNCISSVICFYFVSKSTRKMERKITLATTVATMDSILPIPYRKILESQTP